MPNKDYVPPGSRSGEVNLLNEAIQVAVHSTIQAMITNNARPIDDCRQELDQIKSELKGEFGALRSTMASEFTTIRQDIAAIKVDLGEGKTSFALINQRMDLDDKSRLKDQQEERDRRRRDATPTKGYRYQPYSPTQATAPTEHEPDEKPLIPPKIMNALILAIVAAAGAALWGVISASIWPSAKAAPAPTHATAPEPTTH